MSTNDFKEGDQLHYNGSGFYGFHENDRSLTFVKQNPKSLFTIWVTYRGVPMLVRKDEVELANKKTRR